MDELELQIAANRYVQNCCMMILTETWLHPLNPDTAVQLAGCTIHHQDRSKDSNSRIIDQHCSPDLEALSVLCRPFYLPRELTIVAVAAVYIPPDANVKTALTHLLAIINKQQRSNPNGVHIIAGDFNQACLKTELPSFYQHVDCSTRGNNTLDCVYSNIKRAFRVTPLPHLGQSDHLALLLTPAYTPLRRKNKPSTKTIKTWPEGALSQLQDCFDHTAWDLFNQSDLEEYTVTVLFYIKHCADTVAVEKHIRTFPNQKPWMSREVQILLKKCDSAFRSGDKPLYSTARTDLRRGIKSAKEAYRRRIKDHLMDKNPLRMW